ncbi:hypothetical protein B0H10DRAFT_1915806 [Mycena sp. CBHHK59/15]|nr:hypothetical protein B0H10DRAFT_1915806 [Mycena sp. CBHHK59/15]
MDILAPTLYPNQQRKWITENQETTYALLRCIELGTCAQNQTKVWRHNILRAWHNHTSGEAIWAMSTLRALKNMGYSVLFAPDQREVVQFYHLFGTRVVLIIASTEPARLCFNDRLNYIRSPENPSGIPAWKIFSLHFWMDPDNPLGARWTLSPEDYGSVPGFAPNTYLGYSIEAQCAMHPFVPHAQRSPQVYILAKWLHYFHPQNRAWGPDLFDAAAKSTGVSFLTGSRVAYEPAPATSPVDFATSIANIGEIGQERFYDELSKSVALVGLGKPVLSPTPYDALCLGVPFINPIEQWDPKNPTDRSKWITQHGGLKDLSAPYVYNVFKGDREGFVQAIKDAIANPIQRHAAVLLLFYVLERMKIASVEYRLGQILEHDWRAEAAALLAERKAAGQGPIFML